VCEPNKSQTRSLDFAINGAFSKIFRFKTCDALDNCRMLFKCQPVVDSLSKRKGAFLYKYTSSGIVFFIYFFKQTIMTNSKKIQTGSRKIARSTELAGYNCRHNTDVEVYKIGKFRRCPAQCIKCNLCKVVTILIYRTIQKCSIL